jgi:glycosyltransferase involved in cell wall biosynthesis
LPNRNAREYGERRAGVIVKYAAEASMARERLGAPLHVIANGIPLSNSVLPTRVSGRTREDPDLDTSTESGPSRRTAQTPRRARGCGDAVVIGTAARLHPHKRIEDLVDSFRIASDRIPGTVLRIAGGPDTGQEDYAAMLRSRADGCNIEWLGEISDPSSFHHELDLFAMISEPAGCPNASLEAMAAGLPLIATDVGGVSEHVVDGVTGRLLAPRDIDSFAEALVQLSKCAECRRRMGAAARRHVEENFSLERMVRRYLAVLASDAAVSTMAS